MFILPLPVILLIIVFFTIAFRKIGGFHIPIWLIVAIAACLVIIFQYINLEEALNSVDMDVIFYLAGMFIIGQALEDSHYLEHIIFKWVQKTQSINSLIAVLIASASTISFFLLNDTAAIVGTPAVLLLCHRFGLPSVPLLLTLAFCITVSSIASPIGNPQNLIIAKQLTHPFLMFGQHLLAPTLINLCLLYCYILVCFKKTLDHYKPCRLITTKPIDVRLARLSKLSIILLGILILFKVLYPFKHGLFELSFGRIALISASPILLGQRQRVSRLLSIDWRTLVFFVALFIFIESVWLTGFFQDLIDKLQIDIGSQMSVTIVSALLSQLISNVPLVMLYLPLLGKNDANILLTLSMASTMAGNLLILGAASNIIIIQSAERRGQHAFSFLQFMTYGIPISIIQIVVYLMLL